MGSRHLQWLMSWLQRSTLLGCAALAPGFSPIGIPFDGYIDCSFRADPPQAANRLFPRLGSSEMHLISSTVDWKLIW